jgi:GT2 family glycosyltransferase
MSDQPQDPFDLSVVLPTCNRAALLERAIASVAFHTGCRHEIIVVDGASTDHTAQVIERAKSSLGDRLKVIREDRREGFVRAVNKGLRVASGRNLCWLNDDARPLPQALDLAVHQIDHEPDDVAFVALFHRWNTTRNVAYETVQNGTMYRLCHVRGTLYANFPVGRRATFERLGFLDERFYFLGADPDLSLKAWHAGMRVVPGYGCMIDHEQHDDERRASDSPQAEQDNAALFAKWDLPAKNMMFNDFNPAQPCKMNGLRKGRTEAA